MFADLADRLAALVSRHFTIVLAGIVAVAMFMAIFGRAGHDFSNDEPFTALMLQNSSSDLRSVLVHDNIPLWYVLLRPWRAAFGDSKWGLRSLSLVLYALAIVVTAIAGRRAGGPVAGLLAAWLLATSARIGLRFAATARPYALLCALAAAATAGYLLSLEAGKRRQIPSRLLAAGLVAIHLAGLFTQPLYFFFAAASAVGVLLVSPDRRGVVLAALPVIAVGLYVMLWWSMLIATFGLPTTSWMLRPGITDVMAGYLALWGWRNGWMLAGILLALMLVRGGTMKELSSPGWRFCLILSAVVIAGTAVASLAKPVYSAASTPNVILPALSIAVATALVRLGSARLTIVVSALLFTSAAAYAVEGIRLPDPSPSAASLAAVAREVRCGDRVVAAGVAFAPATWYARKTGWPACVTIEGFPGEMSQHPGWFDADSTYSRRMEFLAEARAIAAGLGSNGRLWVFAADRGAGTEATQLLDDVPELRIERRLPLRGTYFDHVRVYRRAD
ncbi:MAG TPA: hypothetical protein VES67_08675 [Vicinamibacterales bacterium]|nr:hypothetical protein [Vicinamibacterales bacterium]